MGSNNSQTFLLHAPVELRFSKGANAAALGKRARDGCPDYVGAEESEAERHADGALTACFACGDRRDAGALPR